MNKVAFFLPVRAGSQRVKNKNTKPFAGINGGLLAWVGFFLFVLLPYVSCAKGVLYMTFDDRGFDSWTNAIPLFEKYNAKCTFFPETELNEHAVECLKILHDKGHVIGLHTVAGMPIVDEVARSEKQVFGAQRFYWRNLRLQMKNLDKVGIRPSVFSYPWSYRNECTDKFLSRWFRILRGGQVKQWYEANKGIPLRNRNSAFYPVSSIATNRLFLGVATYRVSEEDLFGAIERCGANDELIVLYAHDITHIGGGVHITVSLLESILKKAHECGLEIRQMEAR